MEISNTTENIVTNEIGIMRKEGLKVVKEFEEDYNLYVKEKSKVTRSYLKIFLNYISCRNRECH